MVGYLLGFSVREDVGLEIGGLRKFLVATVEWANVGPVSRVNSNVSSIQKK